MGDKGLIRPGGERHGKNEVSCLKTQHTEPASAQTIWPAGLPYNSEVERHLSNLKFLE